VCTAVEATECGIRKLVPRLFCSLANSSADHSVNMLHISRQILWTVVVVNKWQWNSKDAFIIRNKSWHASSLECWITCTGGGWVDSLWYITIIALTKKLIRKELFHVNTAWTYIQCESNSDTNFADKI